MEAQLPARESLHACYLAARLATIPNPIVMAGIAR